MTYVITSACVDVKHKACQQECPVDCIYEGDRSMYINPNECVNCLHCQVLYQSKTTCPVVIKKLKRREAV